MLHALFGHKNTKEETMSSRTWRKHLCPISDASRQPKETPVAFSLLEEHNIYFRPPLVYNVT